MIILSLTTVNAAQSGNLTADNPEYNTQDLHSSQKSDPNINASADSVNVGSDVCVKITLNESAGGSITVNDTYSTDLCEGHALIRIPGLDMGNYTLSVHYSGDENFLESYCNVSFSVFKNKVAPEITGYHDVNFGETVYLTVTLPEDATGDVIIYNDTSNYTVNLESNIIYVKFENLSVGRHGIVAEYLGDRKYEKSRSDFFFNVVYDMNVLSEAKYSEDVILKINIFEGVNGNITITGSIFENTTLTDGYCELNLGVLSCGKHNITVTFKGNEKYPQISVNHTISVGANIAFDSEVIYKGFSEITLELPEDAGGNLTITINSNRTTIPVVKGSAAYSLNKLAPGDYIINITYSGDDRYESDSLNTIITVIPKIIVPDEITTGVNEFKIILPENAGGNFTVGVDGDETSKEIINGTCSINLTDIESGEHVISILYSGDSEYDEYSTIISVDVVKILPDLDIVVGGSLVEGDTGIINIYSESDANGILLVDFEGRSLYTNLISGHATVNLGSLSKGIKTVTYTYLGDDKYDSTVKISSFNVLSQVRIASANLYMYYKDGSYFKVRIFGNDGNPVGGDVVSFTIKGRTYHVRSNGNGYAYLKINSKSGRYSIITSYKTAQATNTIFVKHVLKSSNVKIKNSTKKFTLKAKLKKHIKGKKITFKVNGKKVTGKTNRKGVCKVTFKKSFIKKLKAGKKYKIKITYVKESIYKTLKVVK